MPGAVRAGPCSSAVSPWPDRRAERGRSCRPRARRTGTRVDAARRSRQPPRQPHVAGAAGRQCATPNRTNSAWGSRARSARNPTCSGPSAAAPSAPAGTPQRTRGQPRTRAAPAPSPRRRAPRTTRRRRRPSRRRAHHRGCAPRRDREWHARLHRPPSRHEPAPGNRSRSRAARCLYGCQCQRRPLKRLSQCQTDPAFRH